MWHVHPKLRGIESVRESAGYYQAKDSRGVTIKKAEESGNTKPTIVCKQTIKYEGTSTVNPS